MTTPIKTMYFLCSGFMKLVVSMIALVIINERGVVPVWFNLMIFIMISIWGLYPQIEDLMNSHNETCAKERRVK